MCGDYFAELGSVEHEKQWSQYRTLWNPERHRDRTRQFAFVDDLLNKRCKPIKNTTSQPTEQLQSLQQNAVVNAVEGFGQIQQRQQSDLIGSNECVRPDLQHRSFC